ncbi:uncharacterized protein LOC105215223 [Zeugodacus cucurbitae]|uniref:uncharacterized protein LOC105215223 n=1 Tax=Zeugodacus cucurbitae TaxID=28588 RepID=UPI000596AB38|nr:uncharacterized protein LOC105215223 [Zeugodacus cucurbitae]
MNYSRLLTMNNFIFILILTKVSHSFAQSFYDFDSFDNGNHVLDRHLPAGYYYISDGRITPVSSSDIRRKDVASTYGDYVYYAPVVRVKHQKTKKKLFVPNLFG